MIETLATTWSLINSACKLYYILEEYSRYPNTLLQTAYNKAFDKAWTQYMPKSDHSSTVEIEKRQFKRKIFGKIEDNQMDDGLEKFLKYFNLACAQDDLIHKVSSEIENDRILSSIDNISQGLNKLIEKINNINNLIISPFGLLKESLSRSYDDEYITDDYIDGLVDSIQKETNPIRLTALSGMGKTRLIYEAFKDIKTNCYYTCLGNLDNVIPAIQRIMSNNNDYPLFIIDDCDYDSHLELIRLYNSLSNKFRLITIYHDPDIRDDNNIQYKWDKHKFKEILTEHVKKHIEFENIGGKILKISDYNPQLIFYFLKNQRNSDPKITNEHLFFKRLIHLDDEENASVYYKILMLLSIFNPVNIGDENKLNSNEIECLIKSNSIDKICEDLSDKTKRRYISNTIKSYRKKELIDRAENYINIRPLPLVFWLIKEWDIKYNLKETIEDLTEENTETSKKLLKAIGNRFEQMRFVVHGDDWIGKLFESEEALFGSAKRLFTELGSGFLCSIVSVAPDAALINLKRNITNASAKELFNLDFRVKMNLKQSVSYFCMISGKEELAIELMARLAITEGETYNTNNAEAALAELFQLYLSGTTLDLQKRFNLMRRLAYDNTYTEIIPQLFKTALQLDRFIRTNSYYNSQDDYSVNDYKPSKKECLEYNQNVWLLLIKLTQKKVIDYKISLNIIHDCIYETFNNGIYKPILTVFEELFDDSISWEKIRIKLKEYILKDDTKSTLPDTIHKELASWIKKMEVNNLLSTFSDYILFCYNAYGQERESDNKVTSDELIEKETRKIARDIANEKWYTIELIDFFCNPQTDIDLRLFYEIGILHQKNEKKTDNIIDECLLIFKNKDINVNSMSWFINYIAGTNQPTIINRHSDKICDLNYHQLLFALYGVFHNENDYLELIFNYINKEKSLNYQDINFYLNSLKRNHSEMLISIYRAVNHSENYCIPSLFYIWMLVDDKNRTQTEETQFLKICQSTLLLSINQTIPNPRWLDQILEWVLSKNPNFGEEYCEHLISFYKKNKTLDDKLYHEKLLKIIGQKEPDALWSFAEFILSEPDIEWIIMVMRLDGEFSNSSEGILFKLDTDRLFEMAHLNPKYAPERLINQFPLFEDDGNNLHPLLLKLLNEFPDEEEMLKVLARRLNSMWGGASLVPIYEKRKHIIEKLFSHPNSNIVNWAKREVESMRESIKRFKKEDAFRKIKNGK